MTSKPEKKRREFPDWAALIAKSPERWAHALDGARSGPKVLFASAIGGHPQFTVVEAALSIALTLRGARADALVCDAALHACQRAKFTVPEPAALIAGGLAEAACPGCIYRGRQIFNVPGLDRLEMSGFITPEERERARRTASELPADQLADFSLGQVRIGEHALAGALRYYCVGELEREPAGVEVLRLYVEAALLTAFAADRIIVQGGYDVVVTNHGIYVPHGIINDVARARGVRTVTWNTAYRRQCAIFSHGETYHHTLMTEPTSAWEAMAWSPRHEEDILSYLQSRRSGARDWIWFNRKGQEDVDQYAAEAGLDWSRPVIGMLTNVVWDAQLHYPANAFPNMLDWMRQTIAWFAARPELQLLIRAHPGEVAGDTTQSRQRVVDEIARAFPDRPPNVFVVDADSPLSTYALMERCDSVIIYGTKTGVELTSLGVPVIVAGEAWIRDKDLTIDVEDPGHYFDILATLPLGRRLDDATVRRARRYAYHFFFRRMVPLPFLTPKEDQWPPFVVKLDSVDELGPGVWPGLDVLCDGILKGTPFVYPAEHLGVHDEAPAELAIPRAD